MSIIQTNSRKICFAGWLGFWGLFWLFLQCISTSEKLLIWEDRSHITLH